MKCRSGSESWKGSPIRRWTQFLKEGQPEFEMALGEIPFPTSRKICYEAVRYLEQGQIHYPPNCGRYELRQALAEKMEKEWGFCTQAEEILVTCGAQEALSVSCLALLDQGDEVIVMNPGYPGIVNSICMTKARPVFCPCTEDFQMDLTKLESLMTERTKAVILSNPVNPTGQLNRMDILCAAAKMACQRDIALVLDLTYFDLTEKRESLKFLQIYADHLILIGSFSKAYIMSGWRIGWIRVPGSVLETVKICHQTLLSGVDQISQTGAMQALKGNCDENRKRITENTEYVWKRCVMMGLKCPRPQGTFYCFADITATGLSDEDFTVRLLEEKKVAVLPGSCFGTAGKGYIRISCALPYQKLVPAMDRMESFVRNCCVRV